MIRLPSVRRHAARLVAIAVIGVIYWLTRLPTITQGERAALTASFAFTQRLLPTVEGIPLRTQRAVHPNLAQFDAWVSSVGAAIALWDLDGDGLPNDLCHVDPRTNTVLVAPVPGTGARYAGFVLDPSGAATYDPTTMAPMGCVPDDMNEDGRPDILVYYWGRTPVAFLKLATDAMAAQSYVAQDLVPGGERWYTNAATFADLDGDGHLDLIVGNYFPDGARILDANAQDRSLDAAQMQHSMSRAYNAGHNRLLRWTGASASGAQGTPSVTYVDDSAALEDKVAQGWTLAVGAADLDGDLLPEIYFANDFGPDALLHNRSQPGRLAFARLTGHKGLTTPNSKVLGHDSFKGMGVDFGDLNGDGLLDIYVSNIAAEFALEESHFAFVSTGRLDQIQAGEAPYVDRSEDLGLARSGWGWEARLADFNNDGVLEAVQATGFVKGDTNRWPELHELAMGNDDLLRLPQVWPDFQHGDDLSGHQANAFFVRAHDGRYYDLAASLGLDASQVTRGIATADVDGDGDLDFAVANQWEASRFYRNECPTCGAFLGLHLRLPRDTAQTQSTVTAGHPQPDAAGRPAIGAAVSLLLPDGRRLVAQVDGGNGHSGVRSPDLLFGLGNWPPDQPVTGEVAWRDGKGNPHRQWLQFAPGWQTVVLADAAIATRTAHQPMQETSLRAEQGKDVTP